jgi:hypothetical protein
MAKVEGYWFKRWEALDIDLAFLKDSVEAGGNPQMAEYSRLIGQLQKFVKQQFEFFFYGFGGTHTGGDANINPQRLEPSLAHPPEYVLRRTLDQAAYDFTIVRLAAAQRTAPSPIARTTLRLAAHQAREYLAVVQDRFIPAGVQVITYFQRGTSIRVIPYADAALIGVPPTAMVQGGWRELLAVGHEVGHYVYQNGFEQGERLTNVLNYLNRLRPAYIQRWQEEIFSDVFGALVTGHPAVFHSAHDMIADNPAYEAVLDDGVHPIDALRLHVYQGVSEWLGMTPGGNAEEFHGAYEYFVTSDAQGAREEVLLTEAAEVLREVVKDLCDFLHDEQRSDMRSRWEAARIQELAKGVRLGLVEAARERLPPGGGAEGETPLQRERNGSYAHYAAALIRKLELNLGSPTDAAGETAASDVPAGPGAAKPPARDRIPRWFEEYRDRFQAHRLERPMPQAGWEVIFFADGWTGSEAHGPETNPPKGGWERGAGLWFH